MLARTVAGPVGDSVTHAAQVDDAMASFLVGRLVVVAADDGTAVATTALVAVPEDLHQVARHSTVPNVLVTPVVVGEITLIGRLAVAFALGSAIGREAVARFQFMNQNTQAWSVGIGTSPEALTVVLPHSIGIEDIDDADVGFHVHPCLTLDFVLRVPDEQCLDEDTIGRTGAERRLCLHRVKARPLVVDAHLVGVMQTSPSRLGKQVVRLATRVVATLLWERVNGSEHSPLPPLVDLVASGSHAHQAQ